MILENLQEHLKEEKISLSNEKVPVEGIYKKFTSLYH